ncbi:MAG: hypothetical protein ThorAB25_04660 [Candidatus Thorarchaeota archaeon AB_25]|nr:MAG: hypothetical protein ThorAB25_04660 [Candidatus Thorarchaeota archaeon AB_25]
MAFLVYTILDPNDFWHWDAPYTFVVTVFRLLSLIVFFLASTMASGLASAFAGGVLPDNLVVGLYNTLVLKTWYMQPYGLSDPLANVQQVWASFQSNLINVLFDLWDNTFLFLYFLCAGIGIALFLQSLVRMDHKFVGGAFLAIQAIVILAAYRALIVPDISPFPVEFVDFLLARAQILALASFAYLEVSYQMIYSYSVGKPVEDREETLKKQLLALRQATRKQDAIERGEKVSTTGMSRSTGATAFSFLREAMERKVMGSQSALESLDAVSDVRRLQIYVDELLQSDSRARDELTAKAAAPSSSYVIGSTITGSAIRFLTVVAVSFLLMSPNVVRMILNLPIGIENSVEMIQPEIVILFLVPVVGLFPFAAAVISWIGRREVVEKEKLTKEEKEAQKQRKKELARKRKEAEEARKARAKARKKRKDDEVEVDEWDKALEDSFKR